VQFLASVVTIVLLALLLVFLFQLLSIVDKVLASMASGEGKKADDDDTSSLPTTSTSVGINNRVVSSSYGGGYHPVSPMPGGNNNGANTQHLSHRGAGGTTRQWSAAPPPPPPSYVNAQAYSPAPLTASVTPIQAKAIMAQRQSHVPLASYTATSPPNSNEFAPVVATISTRVSEQQQQPPQQTIQAPLQPVKLVSALPQAVVLLTDQEEK
jgi:hypothetical protein